MIVVVALILLTVGVVLRKTSEPAEAPSLSSVESALSSAYAAVDLTAFQNAYAVARVDGPTFSFPGVPTVKGAVPLSFDFRSRSTDVAYQIEDGGSHYCARLSLVGPTPNKVTRSTFRCPGD